MIRFLPALSVAAAFACLLSVDQAQAQTTAAGTPFPGPEVTPTPSSTVPPVNISPELQAQVTHERRLIQRVRENTENIQSKNGFGAQLWMVQGDTFFDEWRKPGTPSIVPATLVLRGQTISTVVILYSPGHDAGGLANVHYSITVKRPDGTVYDHRDDLIGYQDLAPTSTDQLLLGRDFATLNILQTDPVGTYTVEANIRDNVSGTILPLKQSFVVQ